MNHPNCKGKIETRNVPRYHYRESGLDNIWLEGGVTELVCDACPHRMVAVAMEQQLLQLIARDLLMRPGFLSGREVRYLRKASRLTQANLGEWLHLRRETIAEWEAQKEAKREAAWEFALRGALLVSFEMVLKDKKQRHLSDTQYAELTKFSDAFAAAWREFFAKPRKQAKTLRFTKRRGDWQRPAPSKKAA
jgi:DNA-binding transcriptional regulator YiaG